MPGVCVRMRRLPVNICHRFARDTPRRASHDVLSRTGAFSISQQTMDVARHCNDEYSRRLRATTWIRRIGAFTIHNKPWMWHVTATTNTVDGFAPQRGSVESARLPFTTNHGCGTSLQRRKQSATSRHTWKRVGCSPQQPDPNSVGVERTFETGAWGHTTNSTQRARSALLATIAGAPLRRNNVRGVRHFRRPTQVAHRAALAGCDSE